MIFTIGTQRLKLSVLRAAVETLKVSKILDWRHGAEETKKLPPESLPALFGEKYRHVGDRCHEGNVTEKALDKLAGLKGNTLLLFFEESPDGPRHYSLAVPLLAKGAKVTHVHQDTLIEAGEFQRSLDDEDDYNCSTWREEPKGEAPIEPVAPVSIEVQRKIEAVQQNSMCLSLSFGSFGNRRKVRNEALEIEEDMLGVSKKLMESPELVELDSFDGKTAEWVRKRSVPAIILKDGFYQVNTNDAEGIEQYLRRRFQERKPLIDAVRIAYPNRIKEAEVRLSKLNVGGKVKNVFNPLDYIGADELIGRLTMEWHWLEIQTSSKIQKRSGVWFEQERAKAAQRAAAAVNAMERTLAAATMDLVNDMLETLTQSSPTGKKKRIAENKLDVVREFLELFNSRNITNYKELEVQVSKLRNAVKGVDTADLKDNEAVRQKITARFSDVKVALAGMVQDAPSRKYRFSNEEDAA